MSSKDKCPQPRETRSQRQERQNRRFVTCASEISSDIENQSHYCDKLRSHSNTPMWLSPVSHSTSTPYPSLQGCGQELVVPSVFAEYPLRVPMSPEPCGKVVKTVKKLGRRMDPVSLKPTVAVVPCLPVKMVEKREKAKHPRSKVRFQDFKSDGEERLQDKQNDEATSVTRARSQVKPVPRYATRGSGIPPHIDGLEKQPWEFSFDSKRSKAKQGARKKQEPESDHSRPSLLRQPVAAMQLVDALPELIESLSLKTSQPPTEDPEVTILSAVGSPKPPTYFGTPGSTSPVCSSPVARSSTPVMQTSTPDPRVQGPKLGVPPKLFLDSPVLRPMPSNAVINRVDRIKNANMLPVSVLDPPGSAINMVEKREEAKAPSQGVKSHDMLKAEEASLPDVDNVEAEHPLEVSIQVLTLNLDATSQGSNVDEDAAANPSVTIYVDDSVQDEDSIVVIDGSEVAASIHLGNQTVSLTTKDLSTLAPSRWLNDNTLNGYLAYIMSRSCKEDGIPSVLSLPSQFYTKLVKEGYSDKLKRWLNKYGDIRSFDLILLPIHCENHWSLICVDNRKKSISHYDSLGNSNDECLQAILNMLLAIDTLEKKQSLLKEQNWTLINAEGIPQQDNNCDCGIFCCLYAEYLSYDVPFNFTQDDILSVRNRMDELLRNA